MLDEYDEDDDDVDFNLGNGSTGINNSSSANTGNGSGALAPIGTPLTEEPSQSSASGFPVSGRPGLPLARTGPNSKEDG